MSFQSKNKIKSPLSILSVYQFDVILFILNFIDRTDLNCFSRVIFSCGFQFHPIKKEMSVRMSKLSCFLVKVKVALYFTDRACWWQWLTVTNECIHLAIFPPCHVTTSTNTRNDTRVTEINQFVVSRAAQHNQIIKLSFNRYIKAFPRIHVNWPWMLYSNP